MSELEIEETEQDEFEPLPVDQAYLVKIQSYDIVSSAFKDKDGNPKKDIKWTLAVEEPKEFYDRVLVFWTPHRLSRHKRTGKPNKTLSFLNYLGFDFNDKDTKTVDLDHFIGKTINVTLRDNKTVDGRIFQKVDNFFPSAKK